MTGPAQGTVAITNVTVHTMDARGTLPAQTVAIEDGRISRMGRAGEVPTAGFDVVDGTGRYLLPGLTDMHAHLFAPSDLDLYLANTARPSSAWAPSWLATASGIARPSSRATASSAGFDADDLYTPADMIEWWASDSLEGHGSAGSIVECLQRITGLLHAAGTPLLIGADPTNTGVRTGFSVHEELEHFRRAGLSTLDVLRCATVDAARFLGQEADWGSVAEGMRADLILSDADPLAELSTLRHPRAVFCNGRFLDRRALDRLLEIRFHDLRHTFATLQLAASTNPKIVSEVLGHKDVAITLDRYSHAMPTMQVGAMGRLDAMLGARRSTLRTSARTWRRHRTCGSTTSPAPPQIDLGPAIKGSHKSSYEGSSAQNPGTERPDLSSDRAESDEFGTACRIPSETSHAAHPRIPSARMRYMRHMRQDE